MTRLNIPDNIESLKPYPPGKPIKELERELGVRGVIKLASNESPFGPSPKAVEAATRALTDLHRYPDGSAYYLRQKLAAHLGQPPERLVFGCGTNEILDLTCRVFVGPGGRAVIPHPSFLVYQKFLQALGADFVTVPLKGMALDLGALLEEVDEKTRLVIICNPNNPTGTLLSTAEIRDFAAALPESTVLLIDEAYIDFAKPGQGTGCLELVSDEGNVIVTRTFSKAYGLAGLRLGYGVMSAQMADYMNRVRQPFNITSPSLAGAEAALDDQPFLTKVIEETWAGLDFLTRELTGLGLKVYPSQTNFLIFEAGEGALDIYQRMLKKGVIIRHMGSFGLDRFLRVSVGTAEENQRFVETLAQVLGEAA